MIITNEVKIGMDVYTIIEDAEMMGSELGSIDQTCSIIRMRHSGYNNRKITERMFFKVLMHEIVHGIDFNTMFVGGDKQTEHDDTEDVIDLITVYIINNLESIIENREAQYEDFMAYVEACEAKIRRTKLVMLAIVDLFDDNEGLIEEFLYLFK